MTDPLVIVGLGRVDSSTENVHPSLTDSGIWIYSLPLEFDQIAEHAIKQLDIKIRDCVHTSIVCSSAYDSYARFRNLTSTRLRPRDVMSSLGISLANSLNSHLPNMQNTFTVEAACASGHFALDIADMIARRDNAVVLLACVDKSTAPSFLNYFSHLGAVAKQPGNYYAPFDQRRSGFAMGEGAGFLAVTTASQARARGLDVLAVIDSIQTQTIFTHPTSPSDPVRLEQFIQNTIAASGRKLKDFAYWDAHAPATPQGDGIEYNIFSNTFKNLDTAISSFKSRIGHCMSSSGVIEIVNAIENIQNNTISPNYNLECPIVNDPRLITVKTSTQKKTFVKTSFGFGGRNGAATITVQ